MPGHTRYCPICKRGTFHTVKTSGLWTFFTCRGGCGSVHKVCYH